MKHISELLKFLRRSPDLILMSYKEVLSQIYLPILIFLLISFQFLSIILLRTTDKAFHAAIVVLVIWIWLAIVLKFRPKLALIFVTVIFLGSFVYLLVTRREYYKIISEDSILLLGYSWGMINSVLIDSFALGKQLTIVECGLFIIRIATLSNLSPEVAVFHLVVVAGIWLGRIYYLKRRYIKEKLTPTKSPSKSAEDLMKFKNLLNHHLPSGLIILDETLTKCLFTNHAFRSQFFELGEDDSAACTILKNMIIDPDELREKEAKFVIPSFNANSTIRITTLSELITHRLRNKRLSDANTLTASCKYSFNQNEKNGTYEVKVFPLDWDGEKAVGISLQDVSYQAELLSLNLANENKEKAISIVAHELRNPISGMLGIVKIMEKKFVDPLMKEFISILKNNISLLLNVLNSILDIKQLNADKLHLNIDSVSISEVLKNVKLLYSFQCAEKKLDFIINIDPSVSDIIYTDRERLSQILINLSGNALKFTSKGSITISVTPHPVDTQRIVFAVSDTGIGIKTENFNKLFKMFGRIEDSNELNKQGVGLGLVISNSLVRVLNKNDDEAYITVASEVDQGTTFSFFLTKMYGRAPNKHATSYRVENEREEDDMISARTIESSYRKKFIKEIRLNAETTPQTVVKELLNSKSILIGVEYILLVDDSSFNLIIFKSVFEDLGICWKQASNGREAVQSFIDTYKDGHVIAMIFMDLEMPEMGGIEASKLINEEIKKIGLKSQVPIVAVSGSDSESMMNSCQEAGMSEFVVKPIKEEVIMAILKKYSVVK